MRLLTYFLFYFCVALLVVKLKIDIYKVIYWSFYYLFVCVFFDFKKKIKVFYENYTSGSITFLKVFGLTIGSTLVDMFLRLILIYIAFMATFKIYLIDFNHIFSNGNIINSLINILSIYIIYISGKAIDQDFDKDNQVHEWYNNLFKLGGILFGALCIIGVNFLINFFQK